MGLIPLLVLQAQLFKHGKREDFLQYGAYGPHANDRRSVVPFGSVSLKCTDVTVMSFSPHSASVPGPEEDSGEFSDHAEEAGREGGAEAGAHLSKATPGQVEVRAPSPNLGLFIL